MEERHEEFIGGCFASEVWKAIQSSCEWLENATSEKLKATLEQNFVPDGFLSSEEEMPKPPSKKLKLSLPKKKKALQEATNTETSQFASLVSEEAFEKAAKGVVPHNTSKNNLWAERTFNAWMEERNKANPSDPVPSNLIWEAVRQCNAFLDSQAVLQLLPVFQLMFFSVYILVIIKIYKTVPNCTLTTSALTTKLSKAQLQ